MTARQRRANPALLAIALAGVTGTGCALWAPFPEVAADPDADACDEAQPGASGADPHDGSGCRGEFMRGAVFGDAKEQRGAAVTAGEGAIVLTGHATGGIDLGDGASTELGRPGEPDAFLGSFDAAGQVRWSRRFADCEGRGVATAPGGDVVVAGVASGDVDFGGGPSSGPAGTDDIFLARFAPSGAHRWSRRFGNGANQMANAVAVDAAGNSVVTGEFWGKIDFGETAHGDTIALKSEGPSDGFIAKVDPEGQIVWAKQFGDKGSHQAGTGVAVDRDGAVVVAGWFKGGVSFGHEHLESAGETDVFLVKLSPAGDFLWSRAAGSTRAARALGVAVDDAGSVFVAGSFRSSLDLGHGAHTNAGDKDIFVAKLDEEGMPLWSRSFGDGADQEATAVAVDPEGAVVLTGWFLGEVDFGGGALAAGGGADGFIAKLDPRGAPLWARAFGDGGDQGGAAVTVDGSGGTWATGYITGEADFGAVRLQSQGAGDAFLVELSP